VAANSKKQKEKRRPSYGCHIQDLEDWCLEQHPTFLAAIHNVSPLLRIQAIRELFDSKMPAIGSIVRQDLGQGPHEHWVDCVVTRVAFHRRLFGDGSEPKMQCKYGSELFWSNHDLSKGT
jgi:hypothetical protein